ncbi:RNA methyltransferase [Falsarthrobacter nasiphocae]|uniref:TrmH family RNA methyltransferase n=1 Tax=Falsarthrobacter nasiphocae TaxID=189863 RepID=A0AAE3YFX1_9MICC|nr:RNA methyltransferase [Falsarthrobacter nasiphocae]MDR6892694.1 TrmH family RNA methyltransferase [Falsarthrobacter nasiphocae]
MDLLSNPNADRIRGIARLRTRSQRAKEGLFLIEGPQCVREALGRESRRVAGRAGGVASGAASPAAGRGRGADDAGLRGVTELFATVPALERHGDIAELASVAGVPVRLAEPSVIQAMADTTSPQGMVAVGRMLDVPLEALLEAQPSCVAVLARVQDPGNAGTILRAADAAGAGGVVFLPGTVDPYNPKVVRSTAGSLFHVPFSVAGEDALERLRASGLTLLAADGYGETDLDELQDEAHARRGTSLLERRGAWLFGNEAQGLTVEEEQYADARVRVPLYGQAESLNVGTAATLCLYASARAQRRA